MTASLDLLFVQGQNTLFSRICSSQLVMERSFAGLLETVPRSERFPVHRRFHSETMEQRCRFSSLVTEPNWFNFAVILGNLRASGALLWSAIQYVNFTTK
eukprot:6187290-Pleurochrysis_carterae.AAC.1